METISENRLPSQPPTTRAVVVGCFASVLAMLVGLVYEQRVLFCGCGSWSPWVSDVDSQHCSQHMFDAYSASHVLHGVVFYAGLWLFRDRLGAGGRIWACVTLEATWEVLENSPMVIDRYRTATIALGYTGDSIISSLCDVGSCVVGYLLAQRMSRKSSVASFAAVELVLLATIRDSLVLNVVMLVYPLEVVKQWQRGG